MRHRWRTDRGSRQALMASYKPFVSNPPLQSAVNERKVQWDYQNVLSFVVRYADQQDAE
jgi:hypothetical protein